MAHELSTALETLRKLKQRSDDEAQSLLERICELEEYSKKLDPIIELVERMPELGDAMLSHVQPPAELKKTNSRGLATKNKIYAVLRQKQLTITEIAQEVGMATEYVRRVVNEDVSCGVLEKYRRFDDRQAIRIISAALRESQEIPGS